MTNQSVDEVLTENLRLQAIIKDEAFKAEGPLRKEIEALMARCKSLADEYAESAETLRDQFGRNNGGAVLLDAHSQADYGMAGALERILRNTAR